MALVAGAEPPAAARLAISMIALQMSIGTLNDLVDAPADLAAARGDKPIPAGLVRPRTAWVIAGVTAATGLLLAAPSGTDLVTLAVVVLAIGYGYDLRLKGTDWSWLPFAIGIPLLPVYGWLGATGGISAMFAVLVPVAMLAGTALAIANARADMDADRDAGVGSVALRLGADRSWSISASLCACVTVIAIVSLVAWQAVWPTLMATIAGGAVVGIGVVVGRSADAQVRERAWEITAVGMAVIAVAWLAGATSTG